MAEGLSGTWWKTLRRSLAGNTSPHSASSGRASDVRISIDISEQAGHRAKSMEEFVNVPPLDLVVTVCDEAAEECPYFPHARHQEHWGFPTRVKPSELKRSEWRYSDGYAMQLPNASMRSWHARASEPSHEQARDYRVNSTLLMHARRAEEEGKSKVIDHLVVPFIELSPLSAASRETTC